MAHGCGWKQGLSGSRAGLAARDGSGAGLGLRGSVQGAAAAAVRAAVKAPRQCVAAGISGPAEVRGLHRQPKARGVRGTHSYAEAGEGHLCLGAGAVADSHFTAGKDSVLGTQPLDQGFA